MQQARVGGIDDAAAAKGEAPGEEIRGLPQAIGELRFELLSFRRRCEVGAG
jgi:hypothetical protein